MICDTAKAEMKRSIAQPGSAPGLGPGGRRFESYHSDHSLNDKELRAEQAFFYAPVAQLDRAPAF